MIHIYFDIEKEILKEAFRQLGVSSALDNSQRVTFQRLTHHRCYRCGSKDHMIYEGRCKMEEEESGELCGDTRHKFCIQKHRMCNYC